MTPTLPGSFSSDQSALLSFSEKRKNLNKGGCYDSNVNDGESFRKRDLGRREKRGMIKVKNAR